MFLAWLRTHRKNDTAPALFFSWTWLWLQLRSSWFSWVWLRLRFQIRLLLVFTHWCFQLSWYASSWMAN